MNEMGGRNIVLLSSGEGSNVESIISYFNQHPLIKIRCIISDKQSKTLSRGIDNIIPTLFLPIMNCSNESYDRFLMKHINVYSPDLVVLSGFMRILSPEFVASYPERIINIHPSLLPKYKGLNTHRRVIENKDKSHGTTVHYVEDELDSGRIIEQHKIIISNTDTEESLQNKVKSLEHQIYPRIIESLLI
jgi:phosphoribosylglycinamide formyltransferase-1